MRRILVLLALMVALVAVAAPASAQDAIQVTSNKFTNNFRQNLLFELEAQSGAKITQIALQVQLDGLCAGSRQVPTFTPDSKIQATYEWRLGQNYLPPGVTGQYWWTLQDEAGGQLSTAKQPFRVDDPNHKWQKLSNDRLALYWYAGGDSFGKALFDRGVTAMDYLEKDTGVKTDRQIQIFIYGNRNDFFRALEPGATEWTGGRAFPDHSIVLINVDPASLEWGKNATTHELTHQVIHRVVQDTCGGMGNLSMPHWMDEGLAVYYENPGSADPQFSGPVRRAIQNDTLVPLRTLTGSFPADPSAANLAYGQSWSVVDFMIRHYGREKLSSLLAAFKAGGHYDDIFMRVLGVDSDGLEAAWRKDIGAKPRAVPTRSTGQATAFPTFSLSTDPFVAPTSAPSPATATPGPVAVNATPVPSGPPASSSGGPLAPVTNLCGGVVGLVVLGLIGVTLQRRRR